MHKSTTILRRSWVIAAACIIAGILLWMFFSKRTLSPLHAIPEQTAIAICFEGLQNPVIFNTSDSALMRDISLLHACRTGINHLEILFQAASERSAVFEHNTIVAAFSLLASDSLHPVFVADAGRSFDLQKMLSKQDAGIQATEYLFKGTTLYVLQMAGMDQIVVTQVQNLLFFSRYSYLVEDALVQLGNDTNWWSKQGFLNDNPKFQIIIQPKITAERLQGSIHPHWKNLPGWLASQFQWLRIWWNDQKWQCMAGTSPQWSRLTNGVGAPPSEILTAVPDHAALVAWLAPGSPEAWALTAMPDKSDFQEFLMPWAEGEIAWVVVEPHSTDMQEDQFLVLRHRDEATARKILEAFGQAQGFLQKYDYQTFEVRQFLSNTLLAPLYGDSERSFRNPVCTIIGNYVIFAPSPSAIEIWIDKYIVNQTLANHPGWLQLAADIPKTTPGICLFNSGYLPLLVKHLLAAPKAGKLDSDVRQLQRLGIIGAVFQAGQGDQIQASVFQAHADYSPGGTSILWKIPLSGAAITPPSILVRDVEKKEKVVLIQDDQFQLYCISVEGEVLWRRALDQPVLFDIQGIDYFKNGRTCFLFNTADAIWLLDKDGQAVSGFPLALKSKATSRVAAIDFDGDKKFCFFIPSGNQNLYGFDQFGRPLPGWNPLKSVGPVKFPVLYFKHDVKDFLVVLSTDGRLFVFNRNAELHFAPRQLTGTFTTSPPQFELKGPAPKIVCMNNAGLIHICRVDGQVSELQLKTGSSPSMLTYENMSGSQHKDFIILNGAGLNFYEYEQEKWTLRVSFKFQEDQDTVFYSGRGTSVGTLLQNKKQISLIDNHGNLHPGFPLAGTTPFVLDQLNSSGNEQILIAGNGQAVYAYIIR